MCKDSARVSVPSMQIEFNKNKNFHVTAFQLSRFCNQIAQFIHNQHITCALLKNSKNFCVNF